jgi:membrane protein implicated in regulation of membrane protease activity
MLHLNDPAKRLVGKTVVVVDPVDANGGRVRLGDGEWSARGGPAAIGERVRITGIDGNCLKVETERSLPPA